MMAFVGPPYHPAVPPYATSHSLCQALFISLPPRSPLPYPHPPTILVLMCCHTLGLPLPPLIPHTTPVGSAGTGSGAASITPALLGPHSWPAASASCRSLPGLHCRGVHIKTHHTVLGASCRHAVAAPAINTINCFWCHTGLQVSMSNLVLHTASEGLVGLPQKQSAVWKTTPALHACSSL